MTEYEQFVTAFFNRYSILDEQPNIRKRVPHKIVDKDGNTLMAPNGKVVYNMIGHAKTAVNQQMQSYSYRTLRHMNVAEHIQRMVDEGLIAFVPVEDDIE